jgi:hypothetical protein
MSTVGYKLGCRIPKGGILHSHCRENLKSYITLTGWDLYRIRNVSPVKYELGYYVPADDILHTSDSTDRSVPQITDRQMIPLYRMANPVTCGRLH